MVCQHLTRIGEGVLRASVFGFSILRFSLSWKAFFETTNPSSLNTKKLRLKSDDVYIHVFFKSDLAYLRHLFGKCFLKGHFNSCISCLQETPWRKCQERPQTLLVPSEQICKRALCNKHIKHHLLFQTDRF